MKPSVEKLLIVRKLFNLGLIKADSEYRRNPDIMTKKEVAWFKYMIKLMDEERRVRANQAWQDAMDKYQRKKKKKAG